MSSQRHAPIVPMCICLLLTLAIPTPAMCQIGVAEIVLSGLTVNKVIQKFEDASSRLLFEGENRGNALLTSLGNQIKVATQNANLVMKDQQDALFDSLSPTSQSYFTQLNAIIRAANGPIDRAIRILEVANLNLIELTNRLPLTEKVFFYVNKVNGLTLVNQKSDYVLSFYGLGFGQDDERRKYKLALKINGIEMSAAWLQREPPYELKVRIPTSTLESMFADRQIKFVPIVLHAEVDAKITCRLVATCQEHKVAEWSLKLMLMPRFPGELSGVEVIKGSALDGVTQTKSVNVTTQGCKSDKPCDWTRDMVFAANERVIGVRYACSGQCGWSYNLRRGGYEPDFDILEGGTKVTVYRHVDGEHSTTVTYYADYQTVKDVFSERPIEHIPLKFNEAAQLRLSSDNRSCSYRLNASLVTGQKPYLDNTMSQSPDGLLTRVSAGPGPNGAACVPLFSLNLP